MSTPRSPLFVDTGPLYARFNQADQNHERALQVFEAVRDDRLATAPLYTSRYVLAETTRLLLYHVDHATAVRALSAVRESALFMILVVNDETFDRACAEFSRYDDQGISLTDHISAILAEDVGADQVCSFDSDFRTLEFGLVPADIDSDSL
jgi:predicted nucleic acid-binding protein